MKHARLLLFGVAVFALTVLLHAPVDRVYGWFAPALMQSPVQLYGLDGTVSAGSAASVQVRNQPALNDLAWTLRPLHLLLGRASFHLNGGSRGTLLDGKVALVPSGTMTLSDLRFSTPVAALAALAGQANLPLQGQAGLQIETLRLRKQWPDRAQATATVRGLGWKLGRDPVVLGDYQALIESETAGIKATFSTLAGALDVTGEAQLGHDRRYALHLQMKPKPDAPPLVGNLVRNLGQPDAQGWYHLRRQGSAAGTTP
ncbi:type II secretion system protein N [Panacagrimonas sp.]|uniref:type II secretion system protein N n=1 Tax=Panacagrimonas sp. TaxID=2480088 RepID=UPI003B52998B